MEEQSILGMIHGTGSQVSPAPPAPSPSHKENLLLPLLLPLLEYLYFPTKVLTHPANCYSWGEGFSEPGTEPDSG